MALKARRQRLVGGDAELIGSPAPVTGISAQDPHSGWVHLQGENWQVRSATPLQVGQQVRVVAGGSAIERRGTAIKQSRGAEPWVMK